MSITNTTFPSLGTMPPPNPKPGDRWYETSTGTTWVYLLGTWRVLASTYREKGEKHPVFSEETVEAVNLLPATAEEAAEKVRAFEEVLKKSTSTYYEGLTKEVLEQIVRDQFQKEVETHAFYYMQSAGVVLIDRTKP